ncbi:MAG TPA: helix-turn-helix domain-containing protein [Edaphobacter sp.]|nr:helix-turn-helix domain-containing protein [Edaphobacter sp.]
MAESESGKKTGSSRKARQARRAYESPTRQRQADETRRRIAAAARKLLVEAGYAGMTIPAVAKTAEVAVPTVYAIFGSKKGIVAELLDEARFGEGYQELIAQVRTVTDPIAMLAFPPRFARRVYEAEIPVEDLLRGAGMVAPELAAVEEERNCQRYDSQQMVIDALEKANLLRPGLDREAARAVMWTLTSRELFRMLVRERGWTPDEYEMWLGGALQRELLGQVLDGIDAGS